MGTCPTSKHQTCSRLNSVLSGVCEESLQGSSKQGVCEEDIQGSQQSQYQYHITAIPSVKERTEKKSVSHRLESMNAKQVIRLELVMLIVNR